MAQGPSDEALAVARREAKELMNGGALATILTGSHARGEAHEESDLDVRAVGDGPGKHLKRTRGFLVSLSAMSLDDNHDAFSDPEEVGEFVPGWRDAVILFDPKDVAAELQQRAVQWTWDEVADSAPDWVAEQIALLGEEVHTLVGNIDQGQLSGAAAIRSQIVEGLATALAVREHLLYGSENELWSMVGEAMGGEYADAQDVALWLKDRPFPDTCAATFRLYVLAADGSMSLLDKRRSEVVRHARSLAQERS